MTSTSNRTTLAGGLGLLALAGCVGDLDVGKKPFIDLPMTSTDGGEDGAEDPGMTSSTPGGSTSGDESSDDGATEDTTTGGPPEVSPPCEFGGPGPAHDAAVEWGVVCGGSQQELVQALAVDGTGAIYLSTQLEGGVPTTVLMGDDEVPSNPMPTLLVTKLAPDGEILWNRFFYGEEAWWYGGSIAVCDDRVYLVATRAGTPELMDFGTGNVDGNMAVVAFDTDGETQWAMATGQNDEFSGGFPTGRATCRGEGVVIQGSTAVDVVLDDVTLEGDISTADNGYVVVLDSDGNASWGTIEATTTNAAALGPSGELVTLGYDGLGAALTRYAADGSLTWQQIFPATGPLLLSSVAIDDAGGINIAGGFSAQLDLGLGALVNSDPPEDPLSMMDGFVSHHDANGLALWTTTVAGPGYDYVSITRLASDGTPAVLWGTPFGSQLLETDGVATVTVANLPGDYVQTAGGHPTGGFGLAWAVPSSLDPFAPPLTDHGGLDFVVTRLTP